MFRAPLCPSSGAHDSVGYHIGHLVLKLLLDESLSVGRMETHPSYLHLSCHPAATREPDGQCGNQHYRRELLMMGIVVPETC